MSEKSDLEISISQFQIDSHWNEIKKSFGQIALDSHLDRFFCAISVDGKVAWSLDKNIFVSDGTNTQVLGDHKSDAYGLCWIDENSLLYMANVSQGFRRMWDPCDYSVRIWHVDTGEWEELIRFDAETYGLRTTPLRIAYNADNQCLAFYFMGTMENVGNETLFKRDFIMFYSLKTGEHYNFIPCAFDDAEENPYLWHGISDDGTVYYQPNDTMEPVMLWYLEG